MDHFGANLPRAQTIWPEYQAFERDDTFLRRFSVCVAYVEPAVIDEVRAAELSQTL